MPFVWATAEGCPVSLSTQCFTRRSFILKTAIEFLNLHGLFAIVFWTCFQNGHCFCINKCPKVWSPAMPCCIKTLAKCGQTVTWRHPVCKDTVHAVSTNNLFCFWPTQGFILYYTVKLFLSGIKGILFSVLET